MDALSLKNFQNLLHGVVLSFELAPILQKVKDGAGLLNLLTAPLKFIPACNSTDTESRYEAPFLKALKRAVRERLGSKSANISSTGLVFLGNCSAGQEGRIHEHEG